MKIHKYPRKFYKILKKFTKLKKTPNVLENIAKLKKKSEFSYKLL